MTEIEETFTRPEFESLDLEISVKEARHHVDEAMQGLTAAESKEGLKFRTTDGTLVAIVSAGSPSEEGGGAMLAYRTAPSSEIATRKASKISEALEPYVLDR